MSESPVLLATDLTPESSFAEPPARALADALSVELEVVHVAHDPALAASSPPVAPPSALADPLHRGEVERALAEWVGRLERPAPAEVIVAGRSIAETLAEHAERRGALLIAVASHGRSGIERLLAGSFCESLLRATSTPMLVVPIEEAAAAPAPLTHRRLLVAIDETEDSTSVLPPATRLARALEARTTLLHVTGDLLAVPVGELAVPPAPPEEYARHLAAAEERLEEARRRFGDLPVDTELLVGDPAVAIPRFADEHPFDLVLMASHGRRGLKRLLVGSTTEKVLRHVGRPVLVFPIS